MLLKYKCNLCSNEITKYFSSMKDAAPYLQCECHGVLEKQLPDFSTTSFETVDNGNMYRRVELRKDAVAKAREKGDNYIKTLNDRERVIKKNEN